jgi:hypothetical protein
LTGCEADAHCHGDNITAARARGKSTKNAGVVEHPKEFDHAGLLVNEPPGTAELLFI